MILYECCLMSNQEKQSGNVIVKVSLAVCTHIAYGYCLEQGSIPVRSPSCHLCLSTIPHLLGETSPNKPLKSYIGYTQRGRAYVIDASRVSIWCEVQVTGGEAAGDLKPGGCSGGTCPVEWRFGRTPECDL